MNDTTSPFADFLDDAEHALAGELSGLRERADRLLARYSGIPAAVDVFAVLGLHGSEDPHTEFLAWLLDPAGSHGAGDRFFRRFLGLIGHADARRLARLPGDLNVSVETQYSLDTGCCPDLLVAVRETRQSGVIFLVEAKIHAGPTTGRRRGKDGEFVEGEDQLKRYADIVEQKGLSKLVLERPFGGRALCGNKETFRPVYVLLHAADRTYDERYRSVRYAQIEHALAVFIDEADLSASVRSLIQQFRTSLLAGALPDNALSALEELRHTRLLGSRGSTVGEALALRRLLATLENESNHG